MCVPLKPVTTKDPCNPNPCGVNTICKVSRKKASCSCMPSFLGNPKEGCHAECVLNSDCPKTKACVNQKCVEPCTTATCGINAECSVHEHTPICHCISGYTGDAFLQCSKISERDYPVDPCSPSPCSPGVPCIAHSQDIVICDECAGPDAIHNPRCRRECLSNSDCPFDKSCLNQKCLDPCPGGEFLLF